MARAAWHELAELSYDRVSAMVRVEAKGRLKPHELEDASQNAMTKILTNMMRTFRGTTMGEWVNATRRLVHGVCVDVQRRERRHSKHRSQLYASGEDGEQTGGLTRKVGEALLERAALDDEKAEDAEQTALGAEFIGWGLPRLKGNKRAVLELDLQGKTCEQIQEELGVSRDVVYKSRERGIKDLIALREQWEQA